MSDDRAIELMALTVLGLILVGVARRTIPPPGSKVIRAAVAIAALALILVTVDAYLGLHLRTIVCEPPPPLTENAFARVRVGMSRGQVEEVLGPPRHEGGGRIVSPNGRPYRERGYDSWLGPGGELLVMFGADGTATDVRRADIFWVRRRTWVQRTLDGLGL